MKVPTYSVAGLLCGATLTILPCQAGEDFSTTASTTPVSIEAASISECSTREITPLFTRYAQTAKSWTLRFGARSFEEVELQEADEVEGMTFDVELIVPLSERWQLRFYYPYHTDADARHIESGNDLDIEGDGGLLDFPSLILDYQFRQATSPGDYNLAAYLGVGVVREYLDATIKTTGEIDRYNHRGSAVLFGLKADKQLNKCWTFIGNIGGRYYWDSDDMHPNSNEDEFFLIDASAAWIYAPQNAWIYPAVEVVYQGDVSDYNSLQVVPQVIIPIGSHVDLNAGISVGLLDDGPSTEGRIQLNIRF